MKKILIILMGVLLVWNEPVIAKNEITIASTIKVAKNALKNKKTVQKKKHKSVKNSKKKAYKSVKKTSQKKKKVKSAKKKVVKAKNKKKTTYKKTTRVRYNVGEIQSYAHSLVLSYGWSEEDYQYLVLLWNRESSWNPNAVNKKSGACGIPQSLPCRKMASEGSDYRTNYKTQIRWGLNYIKARYGSPANAWGHSQRKGWY